ncbi:hypothetical protein SAMN02745123_03815 [Desulforamulus aeronauticus DSM 10349]|uniref:Uncharacterized protein n=2 Tax=Desulforamulus aeronauticus TaxID=53343 RepID=A0A1M6WXA7_9FIRM|nr:hypothetical protein SAMN02745123_03815 [Desulforamulus aeronauticus DSM 10349]
MIKTEDLIWQGPFSWIGYEQINESKLIPDIAGIYLFTFEYLDGYILRSVGVTNSMKRRLAQHTREYKKGNYTLLDVEFAKNGLRKELWHGWQYAKEHQDTFLENKDVILKFAEKELISYRLFISEIADRRKRERIEAALLINAYSSKEPWHDLIDGGMALRGRYNYEIPIEVKNVCSHKLYGLPEIIEI